MDERDDIAAYINTLKEGEGLSEKDIRDGYQRFKAEKNAQELIVVAGKHGLAIAALQSFVDGILQRMIFDGEQLTDLMEPLGLNWKSRRVKELALMDDLVPMLNKRAQGRDISGLSAYEQKKAHSRRPRQKERGDLPGSLLGGGIPHLRRRQRPGQR